MIPSYLMGLNKLLAPMGITLNQDVVNPDRVDLPELQTLCGISHPLLNKLRYDNGCSINININDNKKMSIGSGSLLGLVGIEIPEGGRIAVCGSFWPWTNHGCHILSVYTFNMYI